MALMVHRATRADRLVEGLADLLATPLPDPFATELVITPAKGTERWLSQHLSHRLGVGSNADGVCAGVAFRTPASLHAELLDTGPFDPWSATAMVWPLLSIIDEHADEPWCAPLAKHLGYVDDPDDLRKGRRYSVVRRIAGLFASYAAQRPKVLEQWEAGRDGDGTDEELPADLTWQAQLWRHLVQRTTAPSPQARHREAVQALIEQPDSFELPARLSLFGHSRIARSEWALLEAIGAHRDVHLWLPHASPALWEELAGRPCVDRRADDDSHSLVQHPVLRSLGRDLRELQTILGQVTSVEVVDDLLPESAFAPGLLGHLQSDVAANRAPVKLASSQLDRTVQIHACHGPARQVEVLREVLLGLLSDDPTLEPRDILVMCPDIESFAPLLTAAFGLASSSGDDHVDRQLHPGHSLRVMLADRAPGQTNDLLGVLTQVLELAGGRAPASKVLDLIAADPVRRRFGFDDDDLEQITDWVTESGVRWAFDADHRAGYGLAQLPQNTWRWGLDRVLAGVAVSADAQTWFGATLPLDDVSSSAIDLAGRLAECVERLATVTDQMQGARDLGAWLDTLLQAVESLTMVARGDEWQIGQLHRELASLGEVSSDAHALQLRLPDVTALVSERLSGRPTRANFRSGALTVCTMTPMRSVPHRVTCLLGLDDGVFPRGGGIDGDDLLNRDPMVGERDLRNDDRQLLLDAIMSTTEYLVLTYSGANETTNQPRPPSVPLQELIDCLGQMVEDPDDLVVHHPLQPFAAANFTDDLIPSQQRPFSFDERSCAAALATAAPAMEAPRVSDIVIDEAPVDEVSLAELIAFFRSPAKAFLTQRLEIGLPQDEGQVEDAIAVDLDSLDEWKIGEQMLAELLAGRSRDEACNLAWRTGSLPPGRLGWSKITQIVDAAVPVAEEVRRLRDDQPSATLDVRLDLPCGTTLVGTLTDLYGANMVSGSYSKLKEKAWPQVWIQHLAVAVADPEAEIRSGKIGRSSRSGQLAASRVSWAPIGDPDLAREQLDLMVRLHRLGMSRPLALPLAPALVWARYAHTAAVQGRAAREWTGSDKFPGDIAAPEYSLIWGRRLSFDELLEINPDFGDQAVDLWQPMLKAAMVK
ncbi:MAG TPA: exodeoxyribonuclease V subunit gamma [Marmoricola sp.]|nr:exodeoxyribonuclease V subunit gamma [Nocardioidaceae bacterium]HRV69250.1 exodeoxyribonuclease V subunit gamma [Marmoricola sp.]